jgi:hypothetical protein
MEPNLINHRATCTVERPDQWYLDGLKKIRQERNAMLTVVWINIIRKASLALGCVGIFILGVRAVW